MKKSKRKSKRKTKASIAPPGERPVFEVLVGVGRARGKKRYAIYANGATEGFGDGVAVINRLPWLVDRALAAATRARAEIGARVRKEMGIE